MVKVIVIDKNSNIKSSDVKQFDFETIYKKCNLRKKDNFEERHTWKMSNDIYISLFSKNKGRATNENKYDLPPPLDNKLYFGSMVIVKHGSQELDNNEVSDLSVTEWNKYYEKLFGGFEDLNGDDSYSDEEEIPEHLKTKEGYSKEDGFIVDDDETDEDYIPDDDEEEEAELSTDSVDDGDEDEEEAMMGKESDIEDEEEDDDDDDDEYYDSDEIGSELSEESYIDSD
jgi:hypothetical protein